MGRDRDGSLGTGETFVSGRQSLENGQPFCLVALNIGRLSGVMKPVHFLFAKFQVALNIGGLSGVIKVSPDERSPSRRVVLKTVQLITTQPHSFCLEQHCY